LFVCVHSDLTRCTFNKRPVCRQEPAAEKKVAALEAKLVQKNEVIAELLQELVQLRKVNGGP
jgi:hypothetical protein